jgi:hypothetical protein
VMSKVCRTAEAAIDYSATFLSIMRLTKKPLSRSEAITSSAVKVCGMRWLWAVGEHL